MVVSWEEVALQRKINGNKIDRGDRLVKRKGFVFGTDGKNIVVACYDGVLRHIDLSKHSDENPVLWEEEVLE